MDDWLDVEPFRTAPRTMVVRTVERPVLVLGSTQDASVVSGAVAVARRRSGGGAVLVGPGQQIWVDVWVPRHDPLWRADTNQAPQWVGAWWASALARLGLPDLAVHGAGLQRTALSSVACFAGLGPGEVTSAGRKVVGLAQWRSRQGALFSTTAYRHWAPETLVGALRLEDPGAARAALATLAVGIDDVAAGASAGVEAALVTSLPDPPWQVRRS